MSADARPRCPRCDKPIDAATGVSGADADATPGTGDWSVCLYCCTIGVYTGNGFEIGLPDVDAEIPADVRRVQRAMLVRLARQSGDRIDWPCGCVTDTAVIDGERAFTIRPCSLSCPVYESSADAAAERGLTIEVR